MKLYGVVLLIVLKMGQEPCYFIAVVLNLGAAPLEP